MPAPLDRPSPRLNRSAPFALLALAAAGLAAPSALGQSITNIGVPSGGSSSGASAVSANGNTVAANVNMETAHRWSAGSFTDLGLLPGAIFASADDKRQNQLTDDHIARIVQTYQDRPKTPIDRYARRVSMAEIEKNGFNLNISRYVSTAEDETEISLAATHDKLVEATKALRAATIEHNKFLKELGLPPLPHPPEPIDTADDDTV